MLSSTTVTTSVRSFRGHSELVHEQNSFTGLFHRWGDGVGGQSGSPPVSRSCEVADLGVRSRLIRF